MKTHDVYTLFLRLSLDLQYKNPCVQKILIKVGSNDSVPQHNSQLQPFSTIAILNFRYSKQYRRDCSPEPDKRVVECIITFLHKIRSLDQLDKL